MKNFILKIKPYVVSEQTSYPYANAISWSCYGLYRNCPSCWLTCDLLYVWSVENTDESGNTFISEIVSESLKQFEMTVPKEILDNWGADDTIIDDFVLTYDSNFERE